MKIKLKILKKILLIITATYIAYAIIFALVPYAIPKKVGEKYKDEFLKKKFYGEKSPDRVTLVETPQEAFDFRIKMIQSAETSLDIVTHTVRSGKTTDNFFAEVINLADKGVKVRFLIDAKVGSMTNGERKNISYVLANHPNIEYKVYNKFGLLTPWKWNTLLHDKFIIVDDKFLLLGGRNIGDVYFNPPEYNGRVSNDRDVFVFNEGNKKESVIYDVEKYMELLWNQKESVFFSKHLSNKQVKIAEEKYVSLMEDSNNLKIKSPELKIPFTQEELMKKTIATGKVQFLHNPVTTLKKEPWIGYSIKELALKAKNSVFIQTPYATGNKDLLETLTEIGNKNIEFTMLTNSVSSSPNFPAFSNYNANRNKFVKTGAQIYEFQNDLISLHSKSYLFDERLSIIGSLNLDDRSFYIDTETVLVIDSPEFYKTFRNTLQGYQDNSLVVGGDNKYIQNENVEEVKAPMSKHLVMWIASIFSRLFEFLI